jgi:outer membrane protein OmpA-like peptidoglycan-associated protein
MYDGDGEYFDDYFALLDAVGKNVPSIFEKVPGVVPAPAVAPIVSAAVPAFAAAAPASAAVPVPIKKTVASMSQKAEAEKKLNALQSRTIKVYKDARGIIVSMSDILFDTGKADLKPELRENLSAIGAILQNLLTESKVEVGGHTDNVGGADFNLKLSTQRAKAVLNYLVGRGVEEKRLNAVGYGLEKPIADNKTDEGRAKNRRVELVIKE